MTTKNAIKLLNSIKEIIMRDDSWLANTHEPINEAFNMAQKALKQTEWIPCEKRLPYEYGEYRISWTTSASKKRFVGDAEYEITNEWDDEHYRLKGEWLLDDYIKNYPNVKVIAWKPIEEPYRAGEQE